MLLRFEGGLQRFEEMRENACCSRTRLMVDTRFEGGLQGFEEMRESACCSRTRLMVDTLRNGI